MKLRWTIVAVALVLVASPKSARAQSVSVTFGGQLKVQGFVFDNITDFKDSTAGAFRDSQSFYNSRFRLFTTVESADKKAKAYWALEIGDITWGGSGGASGVEYGCAGLTAPGATAPDGSARVGNGAGGCLGADGVNVETKNLYLQFEVPRLPHTTLLVGLAQLAFVNVPFFQGFLDDDAAQLRLSWRGTPVGLDLVAAKLSEGDVASADDVDLYLARLLLDLTKDLRFTVEGMIVDQRNLAGASLGDTYWVGVTGVGMVGPARLSGAFVYGQREQPAANAATCGGPTRPCRERGFGLVGSALIPVSAVDVVVAGWLTSGDATRGPAGGSRAILSQNSDRLPIPARAQSWYNPPFIAEWVGSTGLFGAPVIGQTLLQDLSGTHGGGVSAQYGLAKDLTLGLGVAYVGATDAPQVVGTRGGWGDWVFEVDAGLIYRFNPNLAITGLLGYLVPERNDPAWAAGFRTQFAF